MVVNRDGFERSATPRVARALAGALALVTLAIAAGPASAQFGRNKVQYDDFEFQVLKTANFDIHYYPEEARATEDLARMSERWYERFARTFQHEFERSKPLIVYADHPDFQQTNTLQGFIGESTGGVTESLKNRVIMPMTGSYWDTDHVLGHELVHAFQYNIAQSRRGGGLQGLSSLPLWLIEGMAEYLSVGREDASTAMWLRDAVARDDFPTIEQMTRESRFFPYRFGQALWAYIGGTYGDDAIVQIFRRALRIGFAPALGQVLGIPHDTLSVEWRRRVESAYGPLLEGRLAAEEAGDVILAPSTGSGTMNLSPSLSPDGRFLAFLSEKDLFSIDLFLADAVTGRIIRKLTSANANPHFDALRYVETSGAWSPDGERFAFVVFAGGDNELVIVETEDGDIVERIRPEGLGAMNNPAWSPDGRYIAFTGIEGGISDLFVYDLEAGLMSRLTQDRNADFHPTWSPDGTTIAFASDRGAETDFGDLVYSKFQLSLIDVETRDIEVLEVFGNVRHSNPQYSPDGLSLYFLSDQDGFSDVYRLELASGDVERITTVQTGVSGVTPAAPAMSVAARTGEVAFSVFTGFEFHVVRLPADPEGVAMARVADAAEQPGRLLPPTHPDRFSRVADYLADAQTGLQPDGTYQAVEGAAYEPSLQLDFVGQPTFGAGADQFGTYIGGGASAYFSDMLGDRILGVAVQAQGTVKDIGGQAFYANLSDRWNWAVSGGRIPYMTILTRFSTDENQREFLGQVRRRVFVTSAEGQVSYPFSTTRRMEFGLGAVRYSFDVEEDRLYLDQFNRVIDFEQVGSDQDPTLAALELDPLSLANASVGYVGDNSFFGFTSPIQGGRFRFSVEGTLGSENFLTAVADWRRYYHPNRNLTVALRGLHFGRYGGIASNSIQPLFLGYESFVRGYAWESFRTESECGQTANRLNQPGLTFETGCPALDRLYGHRLAVANFELRVPLVGTEQFGIINFPFMPTELVAFADAGLAWDDTREARLEFSRSSTDRVPVFSAGVSARFNILGFMILEAYYVNPFQRPDKGPHWGFQLAPGW